MFEEINKEVIDVSELNECKVIVQEVNEKMRITNEKNNINLLIEGDNTLVLKLLQKAYEHKIDLIYIDPPYNTRNSSLLYNDKFTHEEWEQLLENPLEISKTLLNDHGFIFISIDDNEYPRLKLLCDKKFGEKNYIATIVRDTGSTRNLGKKYPFSINHDYLLIYSINKKYSCMVGKERRDLNKFINPDNDIDGVWSTKDLSVRNGGFKYKIPSIDFSKNYEASWAYKEGSLKEKMGGLPTEEFDNIYKRSIKYKTWFIVGKIVFKGSKNTPCIKKYYKDVKRIKYRSIWTDVPSQRNATKELKLMLNKESAFKNPKPVEFIKRIIRLIDNKQATVLDYFAGSGTTGQAVIEVNKEDNGFRKFILINNSENKIFEDIAYNRIINAINENENIIYFKVESYGTRQISSLDKENTLINIIRIWESTFTLKYKDEQDNYVIYTDMRGKYTCILFKQIDLEKITEKLKSLDCLLYKVYLLCNLKC